MGGGILISDLFVLYFGEIYKFIFDGRGHDWILYYRKSGIYCFMRNDFPFERQEIHCKIYFWLC